MVRQTQKLSQVTTEFSKTDTVAWGLLIYFESHRTVNSNELCFPLLVNLLIFHLYRCTVHFVETF